MASKSTGPKKIKQPDGYTAIDITKASIDLSPWGYGTLTIRDPSVGQMAACQEVSERILGTKRDKPAGKDGIVEISAVEARAYVLESTDSDNPSPAETAKVTEWSTWIRSMPSRCQNRMKRAIFFFNQEDDEAKN